jgi:hypothetical protein
MALALFAYLIPFVGESSASCDSTIHGYNST